MIYSLSLTPAEARLGERIDATLHCTAEGDTPQALTFDHKSLTIELARKGDRNEPSYAFPNRRVIHKGDLLIREGSSGGREKLGPGEERSRSFELSRLFPMQLLDVGEFEVAYSLSDGQREVRAPEARLRVLSGSGSITFLLERLDDEDLGVRSRVAGLLHRMTAHGFDYGPTLETSVRQTTAATWKTWWQSEGSKLPWNDDADGATFGPVLPPSGSYLRGSRLGGIAYSRVALSTSDLGRFLATLNGWLREPTLSSLCGDRWVADRRISYPTQSVVLVCDTEMQRTLAAVLKQLAAQAKAGPDHVAEALMVLSTVSRMTNEGLVESLSALEAAIGDSPAWASVRTFVHGLCDLLDREYVPVSGPTAASANS